MPQPLPAPRACVFDLDGTLVNSLRDIAEALNQSLNLLGLPTHPVEDYRYMVGEGVPRLCQRAIGPTHPHLADRLAELARPAYRMRVLRHTRPYPGVPELIARLQTRGVRLAVLSNKPHALTVRVVRTFWPENAFEAIQGYVNERHRKPSPHYLFRLCDQLGVSPTETWLVGDTPTDVQTARAAGARAVAVTWGFRPRADLESAGADTIITHPTELA
jgi:phosphoglycolate phosphatase